MKQVSHEGMVGDRLDLGKVEEQNGVPNSCYSVLGLFHEEGDYQPFPSVLTL